MHDEQGVGPGLARAWQAPPALQSATDRTRPEQAGSALKRISMELSRQCNLRCVYCYAQASPAESSGLSDEEVMAIILEATEAGARLVSIVGGGEPLLRATLTRTGESCIDYANSLGCYCYLYTNCTLMDQHAARWLHARDVAVIGKLNSLRPGIQDELAGVPGSAAAIRRGLDALLETGFAAPRPSRLGAETIVCRQNYDEIPELWRWMRERGIVPEVEIPTMQGRARAHRDWLYFGDEEAPRKYQELFEELLRIDRSEFGFDWVPHPPFPALSCRLFYTNCYINDRGGVQACAGVDHEFGMLRVGAAKHTGQPLAEIVQSEPFQKLRHVHDHLKEPCRGCELLSSCYGCRGAAWHHSGDMFGGDPVCWRRRRPGVHTAVEPVGASVTVRGRLA